jgi:hypothetical protein
MAKTKRSNNATTKTGETVEELARFFCVAESRVRMWIEDGAPPDSKHGMYDWLTSKNLAPGYGFSPPSDFYDYTEAGAPVDDGEEIRSLLARTREAEKLAYKAWEIANSNEDATADRKMRQYRDILKTRLELEKVGGDLYANNTQYVHVDLFPQIMAIILPTMAKELQGFPKMMAPKVNEQYPELARAELEAGCRQMMKTIQAASKKYLGAEIVFKFEE